MHDYVMYAVSCDSLQRATPLVTRTKDLCNASVLMRVIAVFSTRTTSVLKNVRMSLPLMRTRTTSAAAAAATATAMVRRSYPCIIGERERANLGPHTYVRTYVYDHHTYRNVYVSSNLTRFTLYTSRLARSRSPTMSNIVLVSMF